MIALISTVCYHKFNSRGDTDFGGKVNEAITVYHDSPRESLNNVSPSDIYAGKKEVILQKRKGKEGLDIKAKVAVQFVRSEY